MTETQTPNNGVDLDHALHVCVCTVAMNDGMNTYTFDETMPLSWPEVQIIQALWGEENVYNIRPIAARPRLRAADEKQRLVLKYGREAVEAVFAGKNPNIEWFVPGWPKDPNEASKQRPDNYKPPKKQFSKPETDAVDATF